jgi:carboxymethylenebutenolidase
MAVVNIRGDRLYHEHITWDQATVLRQLDLLPEFLPISDSKIERQAPSLNGSVEFQVPVAGVETAQKLRDKNSIPSNQMFQFKVREVQ